MRSRKMLIVMGLMLVAAICVHSPAQAFDAYQLNEKVANSLIEFDKTIKNSDQIKDKAAGILVCPSIKKIGLGIALERGACALQIDGKTVEYYRASNASYGLTAGVQSHGEVMAFMNQEELDKFRESKREWKVGVDASAAVATIGAGGDINLDEVTSPVMVVAYDQKGLMADLSIEGGTYKKIGSAEDYAKYGVPPHRFVITPDVSDRSQPGAATVQMTLDIQDWTTAEQRAAMSSVIANDGKVAARNALAEMPTVGTIRSGGKVTHIQWSRAVKMDDGNWRVILASASPVEQALAAHQMDEAGSHFSLIQLDINDSDHAGTGVIVIGPELQYSEKAGVSIKPAGQLKPIKLTSVSYKKLD